MRVIITGGTGLIGRALAVDLLKDSHEVIALSRRPERATGLPTGMRVERWDARTAEGWGPLVNGADAIVNLAGATIAGLWTAGRKRSIRDSRLNAGRAVVEAIQRASKKPRVVIQSSGVGYYGPRGDELITEESTSGDDFLGKLAVEWEASTAPVESLGVRRAIIRSGAVLSTKGGALPPLLLQYRLFAGGPLGSGRQWLPWIHIVDEVRAIRFLIDNESASGPFNLVAPNPLTNADFGRVLARVLRRPFLIPVPALALRLLAGEMSTILLDGQRAVPRRLQDAGFTFQFPEAEMALRDLLRQGKAPVQESLRMQVDLNE
jgi:uncharacterized protein (TIGR01777 family)